jgi:hypothetical protein
VLAPPFLLCFVCSGLTCLPDDFTDENDFGNLNAMNKQNVPNLQIAHFSTKAVVIKWLIKNLSIVIWRVRGVTPQDNPKLPVIGIR